MKFDMRLSFALIFAIVVETGAGLIWAGKAAERLSQVETRLADQKDVAARLARLEEQSQAARDSLERIEAKLDRPRR